LRWSLNVRKNYHHAHPWTTIHPFPSCPLLHYYSRCPPILHSSPASFNSHNFYYSFFAHSQSYTEHTQTAQQVNLSVSTKYIQMTWLDFHDLSNRFNKYYNGTTLPNPLHDDHALPYARLLESSLRAWAVLIMHWIHSQFRKTILYLAPFKFLQLNYKYRRQISFSPYHINSARTWRNWNDAPIVGLLLG
jgi:hypothetical protein